MIVQEVVALLIAPIVMEFQAWAVKICFGDKDTRPVPRLVDLDRQRYGVLGHRDLFIGTKALHTVCVSFESGRCSPEDVDSAVVYQVGLQRSG